MLIRLAAMPTDVPLFMRQSPGSEGVWQNCTFSTTAVECDACVVYERFQQPFEVRCPPERTLFISAEPPSVRPYHPRFLAQFAQVITSQRRIQHPRALVEQQGLPWHLGLYSSPLSHLPHYDDFQNLSWNDKPHLLSVVCSDKAFTAGHRKRLQFVRALQEQLGEELQFFGRGFRTIEDKWETIVPFQYHIAIENCCVNDYWTEKLSDAILGGTHPFYVGAPNIHRYFASEALTVLPYNSPSKAAQIIRESMAQNVARQSLAARQHARDQVLDEYNALALICRTLQSITSTSAPQTLRFLLEEPVKPPFSRRAWNRLKRAIKA